MKTTAVLALLALLALFSLAPRAAADFITGTVVDSNGVPVAGVNIDAIRLSNGNNINLSNDGTNAAGAFVTTIPADVYDLYFFPPAPPANSHVTLVVRNVLVTGTKSLGTLRLVAGSVVSGHVQNQGGAPVGQVGLVMTDLVTGREVPLLVHRTDAFGNFLVAAPKNAISLAFDPGAVPLQVLVPRILELTPTGNTSMGTLVLQPGLVVTGHVQRAANGLAVSGVDLDFKDLSTGVTLYTPNDNTNALGDYSVVVPAGNYHVDFAAPSATLLAGRRLASQAISANRLLDTVTLEAGAVLSGTVRSAANVLQVNADVDVYSQATGELYPTPGDNTSATGAYSVIVPKTNLRVVFRPPSYLVPLGSDVQTNVLVTANTTLNGVLPAWTTPNNYGTGLAGTGGIVPHITVSGGTARSGNPNFAFELQGGRGGALAIATLSLAPGARPFLGGTLLVRPGPANSISLVTALGGTPGVAGAGSKRIPFPPALGEGLDLYAQFRVHDPAAPRGWSLSDALHFKAVP